VITGLPIAKRFGRTAARTFDTNATETVTVEALGVPTFRHFSIHALDHVQIGTRAILSTRDTLLRLTVRAARWKLFFDFYTQSDVEDFRLVSILIRALEIATDRHRRSEKKAKARRSFVDR